MAYQIKILMLAFAIAFVISLIVIPILRRRKIGQQERDDGPKSHLKKQGTPTMGGIVMIFSHNNNRSNSIFKIFKICRCI